jgi:hypothetical protein
MAGSSPATAITAPEGSVQAKVQAKLAEAERKAWVSLAGYKFVMFGYWAGQWVLCKSLLPFHVANPFAALVRFAKDECARRGWLDKGGSDDGNA